MIKIEHLSYSTPQKDLYDKISFTLQDDKHCALIGTSGTGKSTLVDIILHSNNYIYDGMIEIDSNCRIGYVSQFSQLKDKADMTVFEYVAEEFLHLQNEITAICTEMETSTDLEPIFERYQKTLEVFQSMDGDNFESNIAKKLKLANLEKYSNTLVSNLSGGEFKLVQITKEMLLQPNLLIMDEPDVFLDFDHLNSLKELINVHKGNLLVITHNRYLLNHCFNKILHLENTQLQEFDGTYVDYNFSLLQRKIELQEMAAQDQAEIERNQQIVDKLRADATYFTSASRGRALNARVSLLNRLEARKIKEPFVHIKQPDIHFKSAPVTVDTKAIALEHYHLSFDEVLLDDVSFEIKATDKVALIGANGTGKTTLLRDINKNQSSAISISDNIQMAYLSQLQDEMQKESNTIIDEFMEALYATYQEVEAYLKTYGFEEEFMHQKIGSLSGGEKNLLQIAKIAANPTNFLLLDEPTSHLDTYAQMALENALNEYQGGILMISHDFYSIVNCMDYVLLIEDKTIRRLSIRKFRKMIYANHFDKDYLEMEQKKKELEDKVAFALKDNYFELAKDLSDELEAVIAKM